MKKIVALGLVSAALLAFGCATGHPPTVSVAGGSSETQLTPDTWRVLVEGNGFATRGEIEKFLLRRCAELTLERGKRYFVLTEHDSWTDTLPTEHGFVTSPANEAVVTALADKDQLAFDAVQIIRETNEAAEGKLSAKAQGTLEKIAAHPQSTRFQSVAISYRLKSPY